MPKGCNACYWGIYWSPSLQFQWRWSKGSQNIIYVQSCKYTETFWQHSRKWASYLCCGSKWLKIWCKWVQEKAEENTVPHLPRSHLRLNVNYFDDCRCDFSNCGVLRRRRKGYVLGRWCIYPNCCRSLYTGCHNQQLLEIETIRLIR